MSFNCSKRRKSSEKIVNDIVHGIVKLPPHILEIIDTVQFQRLRWISQMGFTQFVYPTSNGTKFEHSIGTFHLASQFINQIQNQIKEDRLRVQLTNIEIKCVEIAALCHDLGQGPYSHSWEHEILPLLNINKKDQKNHKDLSWEILSDILNNTDVIDNSSLRTCKIKDIIGLDDDHIDLIRRIILGKYEPEKDNKKRFLFEIVTNKDSGLDVDKFDYLCRDTIHLGWSNKNKIHDIKRIIHFFRVIKDDKNEWRLGVKDKEIFNIHEIFYSRHMLHRNAFQHKTVKAVDCMFKEAMKRIIENNESLKELIDSVIGKRHSVDEYKKSVLNTKEFISKACDFHIWNTMDKYTREIVQNIYERNLYRLYCQVKISEKKTESRKSHVEMSNVKNSSSHSRDKSDVNQKDETKKESQNISEEDCAKRLEEMLNDLLKNNRKENSVKITLSIFSLSNEDNKNPFLNIPFYQRDEVNRSFMFNDSNNKPPELAQLICKEFIMMIFTEHPVENQQEKNILNDTITTLCTDIEDRSQDVVFVDLRRCYKFTNIFDLD